MSADLLSQPEKKAAKTKQVTAADIRAGLQRHYPQPRYAVLFEVTNATGAQHTRSADAMVMSCWPSNGLDLTGMEIKVYRSDWLKEMRSPKKAEPIAAYCDRWTLVTGPGVVNDLSEIPMAWGWLVFDGRHFVSHREPAKNPSPLPIDRLFLAALLRRVAKTDDGMLEATLAKRMEDLRARNEEEILRRVSRNSGDFEALKKTVTAFEEATGIKLTNDGIRGFFQTANGGAIGKTVMAIHASGLTDTWGGLARLEKDLRSTIERIEKARELIGAELPAESS